MLDRVLNDDVYFKMFWAIFKRLSFDDCHPRIKNANLYVDRSNKALAHYNAGDTDVNAVIGKSGGRRHLLPLIDSCTSGDGDLSRVIVRSPAACAAAPPGVQTLICRNILSVWSPYQTDAEPVVSRVRLPVLSGILPTFRGK